VKNTLLTLFSFLITSSCYGANDSNTQLSLSPSLLHFDYTEFNTSDQVLDRETGWLGGIEAKLGHAITADWFINIHSSYYQGTVDYDGQTQQGTPHTTDTGTNLFRYGAQIERAIYQQARLFVGAQAHQWDRDINDNNNVSGISETYKWIEYAFGVNADIYSDKKNLFNIEAAYLLTRNATIDVDLSRVDFGSATLDIGDGTGGRLNLNWKRKSENNIRYGLTLFIEAWNFGRSNTNRTQGGSSSVFVTEPRSETRNAGLKFNIEYYF